MKGKRFEVDKVKDLESMFNALGCNKPFRKKGIVREDATYEDWLTKDGYITYSNLVSVLYYLRDLGFIGKLDIDGLDAYIDEVTELGY